MRKLKCSKCGNTKCFSVIEYATCTVIFDIENEIATDTESDLDASVFKVRAVCDICRHAWTLKKVYDVYDLDYKFKDREE